MISPTAAAPEGSTRRPVVLVAAVARDGGIGFKNGLPWRLRSDMMRFKAMTMGMPVIMGRKTYQSIGRPLPGRHLVVVSRDPTFGLPPGLALARDPGEALHAAELIGRREKAPVIMVAGGATLYAGLIGHACRLELTEVDIVRPADAFFPPVDAAQWREIARETHGRGASDEADFDFVTYERR